MKATIAWWNLDRSEQTIDLLRKHLGEGGISEWENVQGMRLKFWISDPENNLWGAVLVWESEHAMHQVLPPNRASELIGYPPTTRFTFEVEARITGKPCCNKRKSKDT